MKLTSTYPFPVSHFSSSCFHPLSQIVCDLCISICSPCPPFVCYLCSSVYMYIYYYCCFSFLFLSCSLSLSLLLFYYSYTFIIIHSLFFLLFTFIIVVFSICLSVRFNYTPSPVPSDRFGRAITYRFSRCSIPMCKYIYKRTN